MIISCVGFLPDGRIVRRISCHIDDLEQNQTADCAWLPYDADVQGKPSFDRHRVVDGKIIECEPTPAPPRPYDELRREAILTQWPVEAQLEAHAEAVAGFGDKLKAFLADYAAIKEKFSKSLGSS